MDCDGWLSTKNKKKMQKPPQRIRKTRTSTSKLSKSSPLQFTHSPPPKQLFTSTKQSSLNDFFSSNTESQLEVEVIFDHDVQSQRPKEEDKHSHCPISYTPKACTKEVPEMKRERNCSIEKVNEDDNKTDNAVRNQDHEISEEKLPINNGATAKGQIKNRKKSPCNLTEKGDDKFDSYSDEKLTESVESEDKKSRRIPLKRIHCAEDSNVNTDNPLKRARLEFPMNENDLELNEKNNETSMDILDNNNRSDKTNTDYETEGISFKQQSNHVEPSMENDSDVISSDLPFSCFNSQTLDLGSQLSLDLNTQDTELSSLDDTQLETQSEMINTLQKEDITGFSLTVSYETDNVNNKTKNGEDNSVGADTFTLTDYQSEISVKEVKTTNKALKGVNDDTLNMEIFTLTDSPTATSVQQVENTNDILKGVNDDTYTMETSSLIDSQDDMLVDTVGKITSSCSLDLASENQSSDSDTETNNTLDLSESPTDPSHHTLNIFSTLLPGSASEYQSLEFS